jgi:hypothetical protein
MGSLEDRLCDVNEDGVWECMPLAAATSQKQVPSTYTIPSLTSADLRAFAEDMDAQIDPETMRDLGDDAVGVAAALNVHKEPLPAMPMLMNRDNPPLPLRAVSVGDDEAILRLEAAVGPYVNSIEKMQAELATRLDAVASRVEEALKGSNRSENF